MFDNFADMSSWCKQTLREILSQATYENNPKQNGPPVNIVEMFKDVSLNVVTAYTAQIDQH